VFTHCAHFLFRYVYLHLSGVSLNNQLTAILFWALIFVNLVGGVAYGWLAYRTAAKARLTAPHQMRWVYVACTLLLLWAIGAVAIANSPLFIAPETGAGLSSGASRPSGALLVAPISILFCNALLLVRAQRTLINNMPLHLAILGHTVRVPAGAILVLLFNQGMLPASFGLEAGIGDMIAGLFAPVVAYLTLKSISKNRTWILLWNVFGLLDLVNAIRMAALVLTPFFNATGLPALIGILPAFGVPLLLSWHLYIFVRLLKSPAANIPSIKPPTKLADAP
jgi:hypothetical protein